MKHALECITDGKNGRARAMPKTVLSENAICNGGSMTRAYLTLVLTVFACESIIAQVIPVSSSAPITNVAPVESQRITVQVPMTIRFSGRLKSTESTAGSVAAVTFSIYSEEEGNLPLWSETQNVQLDSSGRYSVLLGQMGAGLPLDIFDSVNARWIGVVSDGYSHAPRTRIASVPYALKALDAQTLGGRPASDFALAQQPTPATTVGGDQPPTLPVSQAWTYESTAPQGPSFISDATSGSPFAVNSQGFVANLNVDLLHGLPATAFAQLATTNRFLADQVFQAGLTLRPKTDAQRGDSIGRPSSGLDLAASAFNTGTSKPEREVFRWRTEAVDSNSASPSGRLSLLFGSAGSPFAETGFSINADGTANLVPGQQIPLTSIQAALVAAGLLDSVTGGPPQAPVVNSGPYQWQQTPGNGPGGSSPNSGGIQVGANVVTLNPCPKGVNGNDVWHYLYISGTGTPEAVLITGGSCTSGATSGTIEFSAANSHSHGYTIGTATAGVQEAVIVAAIPQSNGTTSRNVQMSPGSLVFNARLSIRTSGLTINGSGTTIVCAVQDTCIMVGDPSNSNLVSNTLLQSVTMSSNVPRSPWPAVEDNGQVTVIDKLMAGGTIKGNTFKSLIQIDNDQAAQITGLDTNSGMWSLCDATYCSTAVVGAGPAGSGKNAGVIWIQNSNLGLQCSANGIDNQDGNTLQVQNTVVEAYPQFGIRSQGTYGDVPNVSLNNVYEEIGNCVNPLGTGMAGLIVEGGYAQVSATTGPAGQLPQYLNSGTIPFGYYIVVHSSQMGVSPVYLAGYALSDGATGIPVKWDQVGTAGAITYDVLRTNGNPAQSIPPYGTGNYAVATGVTTAACSNMVCSFVDNPAVSPSPYTVATSFYSPALRLWPAGVVLTTAWDEQNTGGAVPTKYFADTVLGTSFVNSEGGFQPSVFAQECDPLGSWSPIWMQCQGGNAVSNDNAAILSTIIQMGAYGGTPAWARGLKGRTIYELPADSSISATEIITLGDANVDKTTATPGNRPSWDSNDTYLGVDQISNAAPLNFQLALGAPVSISNYIGSVPDGTDWIERLTSSLKTFKVPVSAAAYFTSSDCASAAGICGSAPTGKIAITAGTKSVTVWTTQVTAQSVIHLDENFSYGSLLGVSCDTSLGRHYAIAAQWPGVGFSVITDVAPANGAACLSFSFEN